MKTLLSCALLAGLMLAMPSLSMAKGSKTQLSVKGVVTAVTEKSITIKEGKKQGGSTKTISVPPGTPIKEKGGSSSPTPGSAAPTPGSTTPPSGSTAPTLSQLTQLVGKHVKIKESVEGTASEIIVRQHGGKKHKGKKKA